MEFTRKEVGLFVIINPQLKRMKILSGCIFLRKFVSWLCAEDKELFHLLYMKAWSIGRGWMQGKQGFRKVVRPSTDLIPFWQHLLHLQPVQPLLSPEVGNFLPPYHGLFFFCWSVSALICSSAANSLSVSPARTIAVHMHLNSRHCHHVWHTPSAEERMWKTVMYLQFLL